MNVSCAGCRDGTAFQSPFSMAFQPIVDVERRQVFAHEAPVRGPKGESAGSVLSAVDESTGLNLLAKMQPDIVKIDRDLIRDTGVTLIQGYRLARPSFERLTPLGEISFPN